ncbi:PREDICTED: multisubstrate pseudouridine synthase 7 [Tarenaya hassleriana]|uniref:multisubstrate pseudouridine synthase 7 n=1 Tax=Tarenaya hassleriana TaxID=28532 RepID=UPI00053C1BFA|nr:PREDICTED: multisubstrate pseudouridine synthase 7 [Tarenaya hassleriana]
MKLSSCLSSLLKPYLSKHRTTTTMATTAKSLDSMKNVEESDVGISCFISQLPGFRGILKQRYSDFIVNEADMDGNVVHLTSLDVPPEMDVKEEKEIKSSDNLNKSYASEFESFRSIASASDAQRLEALIDQITSGSDGEISPIVLDPSSDKSKRTAIHNFFKEHFKFLVTDTVDGPDFTSKCIRVRVNSGGINNRGKGSKKRKERGDKPFDSRGSEHWPEHLGKFLRFHLYKENKDTQEALGLIGKMLGVQPKSFGFSGTKDKRSVSTQRVTVFKQHASKLAALNKRLFGIKVGDFCYVKEGLLLGQLMGNRFTITLRGVVADSEETIKNSAEYLGKHGFINYFGLQRFGSGSVPTHQVGAALMRGEWKNAVDMILDPRESEKNLITEVRAYYKETGDIDGTLKQLPRHLVAERAILQCLKKCPGNYLQALKAIPRTLRMMYVHSYQSYLWNHAASMRVQKYGTNQVVLGDLVYSKLDDTKSRVSLSSEHEENNEAIECGQLDETSVVDLPGERSDLVKVITAEDIESGTYSTSDIILPLPGSRVIYPSNDVADIYHDLAKKNGIDLTESSHGVKEFSITSMTGGYRRILQKPIDFEWELLTYTDSNTPLAETDLDRINKTRPLNDVFQEDGSVKETENESLKADTKPHESSENDMKVQTEFGKGEEDGPEDCGNPSSQQMQVALKMAFTLPSSCYATMAIRELLKTSTSVAYHKTLNQ